MGRQRSEIEVIEEHIQTVEQDVQLLLGELGMHALELGVPLNIEGSELLFASLAKEKSLLDALKQQTAHLKQIGSNLTDSNKGIRELKKTIAQTQKELQVVFSRIGVIAWEESVSGVLASELDTLLPSLHQRQQQIENLRAEQATLHAKSEQTKPVLNLPLKLRLLVLSHRFNTAVKENRAFFEEVGQLISQADALPLLVSSSAPQLHQEVNRLQSEIEMCHQEVTLLQQQITEQKGRLEEVGVSGSIERKVQELQQIGKERQQTVNQLAIGYGTIISESTEPWKGREIPPIMLTCYDQIARHQRIRKQLQKKIGELNIESEIGELVYLIEQDEERILHIRGMIDQHNRQIVDIQKTIGANREKIGSLKQALSASLEQEM
ncbi:MAG: hypothetical protein ACOXZ4_03800 [Sphaerochaetaceae bacterium]